MPKRFTVTYLPAILIELDMVDMTEPAVWAQGTITARAFGQVFVDQVFIHINPLRVYRGGKRTDPASWAKVRAS